jgi:hypothetical protein
MADEDAGTISAKIRLELDQLEKDGLQAQKMMDHYAQEFKKEGEKGGKVYVKGFGKGQLELNKKLNEMVSSFRGISPKMGAFGDKLAKTFSKPIFSMIPTVQMAFQTMLPVIGTIIAAVAAIAAVVKKGLAAWKEQTRQIKAGAEAAQRLNGTYKETEKNLASQVKLGDRLRAAFQPMVDGMAVIGEKIAAAGRALSGWLSPLEGIVGNIEKSQAGFATLAAFINGDKRKLSEIYAEQLQIIKARAADVAEARILKEEIQATNDALKQYKQRLDEIATEKTAFNKDEKTVAAEQLSALESVTSELIKQRELAVDKLDAETVLVKNIDRRLGLLKTEKERLEAITNETKAAAKAEKTDAEKINEARLAAIEKYNQAVKTANDAKAAGLINELELQNRVESALAAEYADLEAIAVQYRNVTGGAKAQLDKVTALRDTTAEAVKVNRDLAQAKEYQKELDGLAVRQGDTLKQQEIDRAHALAQAAKTEAEQNRLLDDAIALENRLITAQRERAKEALQQEEWFRNASSETQKAILKDYDEITKGMLKTREEAKEENLWTKLFGENADEVLEVGAQALAAFQSVAEAITAITQRNAQDAIEEIERLLEKTQKDIEDRREAGTAATGCTKTGRKI